MLSRLKALFRVTGRRKEFEQEMAEELRFHIDARADDLVRGGMNRAQAERQARIEFGAVEAYKEECRSAFGARLFDDLRADLRYAFRQIRRSPGFAVVAVLSLALGIGVNTALYGVAHVLFLKLLPVPEPHRLVQLRHGGHYFSYPLYQEVQRNTQSFSGLMSFSRYPFQIDVEGGRLELDGAAVSGNYFQTLGVSAQFGRVLLPEDDRAAGKEAGERAALVSDAFWKAHFGGGAGVLGRTMRINGAPVTIVGVLPAWFQGAEAGAAPAFYVTQHASAELLRQPHRLTNPGNFFLLVFGRLKPGVTVKQARAEMDAVSGPVSEASLPKGWEPELKKKFLSSGLTLEAGGSGWSRMREGLRTPLLAIGGLAALVLLIACVNLANLLMARGVSRRGEVALRCAIGAGRGRIFRQFLTESGLLALAGGAAALFASWPATVIVVRLLGVDEQAVSSTFPDAGIAFFCLGISFLTALLSGALPAWRAASDGAGAVPGDNLSARIKTKSSRLGRPLLALQAGLSVVLVSFALLFGGTLGKLKSLDTGFSRESVTLVKLDATQAPREEAGFRERYRRLLETVQEFQPEVLSASMMSVTPLQGDTTQDRASVPGEPERSLEESLIHLNYVGPRFFETMRTQVLAGREFGPQDRTGSPGVVVINESAVRWFFPKGDALGRELRVGDRLLQVVGICADAKYESLRRDSPRTAYLPVFHMPVVPRGSTLIVRTRPEMAPPVDRIRREMRAQIPELILREVQPYEELVDESLRTERLLAGAGGLFGGLALLIAAVGIYGILAFATERRTSEIGLRVALGATPGHIIRLVTSGAVFWVAVGAVIGTMVAANTTRLAESLLFGLKPAEPTVLAGAAALLLLVAAAATWPAVRRALRLDPANALKHE